MNHNTLVVYFNRYGWTINTTHETLIVAGVTNEYMQFTLVAAINGDWVSLHIPDYILDPSPVDETRFFAYLLLTNNNLDAVRFSIQDDTSITLSIDLPAEGLSYESFRMGIDTLMYYAESLYPNLRKVMVLD